MYYQKQAALDDTLDFEVDQYLERGRLPAHAPPPPPQAAHQHQQQQQQPPLYGGDLEDLVDSLLMGDAPYTPPSKGHQQHQPHHQQQHYDKSSASGLVDDFATPAPYSAPRGAHHSGAAAAAAAAAHKTFAGHAAEPALVDRPIRLSEGALAAAQSQFNQHQQQQHSAPPQGSHPRGMRGGGASQERADSFARGPSAAGTNAPPPARREPSQRTESTKPASAEGGGDGSGTLRVDTDLMLRRMTLWNARKDRNIDEKRKERYETEMQECTFQPLTSDSVVQALHSPERLLRPSPLYRDNKGWGFDEFVQRQEVARQRKEEQKRHEEVVFTAGNNWKNRVTVPVPFELGKHRHRPTSSLAAGGTRHGLGISSVGAGSSRGMARIVESLRAEFDVPPSKIEPPSIPPGAFSSVSMASRAAMHNHRHAFVQGSMPPYESARGAAASTSVGGRPADWEAQIDALVQEFF